MKIEDKVLGSTPSANAKEKEIQAAMEEQMRILRDHVDTIMIRLSNQIIKLMQPEEKSY